MNFDHIQKNKPFIWWVRVARFRQNMVKSRNWTGDMHQHVPGVNGHGMETKMDRQREPLWPYTQTMFLQFFSIWNLKDTNARPIPDNYRSGWKCAQLIYIYIYILYANYHSPALLSSNIFSARYVPLPLSRGNAANPCTCQLCLWVDQMSCLWWQNMMEIWWEPDGRIWWEWHRVKQQYYDVLADVHIRSDSNLW